ncbi:TrmB family transcriptional regulator [Candidatus Woesearchaeota archaeon]|nr:TrmB family transcriptional regulator [Candidatus Woesearchaeota archaeon]
MKDLSAYGLSSYESKAYLTLVREGACSAPEVSKKSGVPYGKIYPVLDALEAKGFLTVSGSRPKRFIAVEPQIIFEAVMQKKNVKSSNYSSVPNSSSKNSALWLPVNRRSLLKGSASLRAIGTISIFLSACTTKRRRNG